MAFEIRNKSNERTVSDSTKEAMLANRKYSDLTFSIVGKDKIVKNFAFSQKFFDSLDLSTAGLKHAYDADSKTLVIMKVPVADATFMKGKKKSKDTEEMNEKGRTFTHEYMVKDLQDAGLIPQDLQKGTKVHFDLEKMEGGLTIGETNFPDVYVVKLETEKKEEVTPSKVEPEAEQAPVEDADTNESGAAIAVEPKPDFNDEF